MSALRHHLRFWVTTWLVFQAVSVAALVPYDCCAGHRAPAAKEKSCHKDAAAVQCPLKGTDAQQCPMHQSQAGAVQPASAQQAIAPQHHGDHGAPADRPSGDSCSMRGLCNGPMDALFAVLATHGVMPESFAMQPGIQAGLAPPVSREHLVSRLASPDSPPPRA
jgi:hypothetical protein